MSRSRLRNLVLIGSAIAGTVFATRYLDNIKPESSPEVTQQISHAQVAQLPRYFSKIEDIPASSPEGHYLFHSALYSLNYFVAGHGIYEKQLHQGSYFYNFIEQLAQQETDSQLGAYTRELIELYFPNDKNPNFQKLRTSNTIDASLEDIKWILTLKDANPREKKEKINSQAILDLQQRVALDYYNIKPFGNDSTFTQSQIDEVMDLAIARSLFFEDLRDLDPSTIASYKGSRFKVHSNSTQSTSQSFSGNETQSHSSLEDLSSSYYPEQSNPTYYPQTHRRDGVLQTEREDVKGTLPLEVIIDDIFRINGAARVTATLLDENGNLINDKAFEAFTTDGRILVDVTKEENIGTRLNNDSMLQLTVEGIDHRGHPLIKTYNINGYDLRNPGTRRYIGENNNIEVEDKFSEVDGVELPEQALTVRLRIEDNQ